MSDGKYTMKLYSSGNKFCGTIRKDDFEHLKSLGQNWNSLNKEHNYFTIKETVEYEKNNNDVDAIYYINEFGSLQQDRKRRV